MDTDSRVLVSVVLPVFNAESTVRDAVQSILNQSYQNIELIVIDDGSVDATSRVLASIVDSRLRVVRTENRGIASALSLGVNIAAGSLIARQDADDVSLPGRIELQTRFLAEHPECVLVGGGSVILSGGIPTTRRHAHPTKNGSLQILKYLDCFFVHSTVMFRRLAAREAGNYSLNPDLNVAEDYEFWLRLSEQGEIRNLPEPLILYAESPQGLSRVHAEAIRRSVATASLAAANSALRPARWRGPSLPEAASAGSETSAIDRLRALLYVRELANQCAQRYPDQLVDIREGERMIQRLLIRTMLRTHRRRVWVRA